MSSNLINNQVSIHLFNNESFGKTDDEQVKNKKPFSKIWAESSDRKKSGACFRNDFSHDSSWRLLSYS